MGGKKTNAEAITDRLLGIHMLYSFTISALAFLIPLYLLNMQVDIALVGLILSLGPLSFTVIRVILANFADAEGTRRVAVLYSSSNLLAVLLYMFAVSPIGFALATLAEGVRTSGFWAIARTDVVLANGAAELGRILTKFSIMRQLADGAGRVVVGFLMAYFAFQGALGTVLVLSLLLMWWVVSTYKGPEPQSHFDIGSLKRIFHERPATFWKAAVAQLLVWLPYNMLLGFLMPVYFVASLKLSYGEAGTLLALLSLSMAVFALIFMRLGLSKRALLALSLLTVPALIMFPMGGREVLPLLLVLGIGIGCSSIMGEYALVEQVHRDKDLSTDIGVLYAPLKIAEFLFLALGGVLISAFGYLPLFTLLAVSTLLFVVFVYRTHKAPSI